MNAVSMVIDVMDRDLEARCERRREREAAERERQSTAYQFAADLADLFRVLRVRDGLPISEAMIEERVRNGLQGFFTNYEIKERP